MTSESDQLLEYATGHIQKLLSEYWVEFWSYRDGERDLKGNIGIAIGCEGREYTLTSSFAYGIRVKRQEITKWSAEQLSLDLGDSARAITQKAAL